MKKIFTILIAAAIASGANAANTTLGNLPKLTTIPHPNTNYVPFVNGSDSNSPNRLVSFDDLVKAAATNANLPFVSTTQLLSASNLLFGIAILGSNELATSTYFVDNGLATSSDSNAGTNSHYPLLTISNAFSKVATGQRAHIVVRPGTYAIGTNGVSAQGKTIWLEGAGMGVTVVTGAVDTLIGGAMIHPGNNFTLSDLTITNNANATEAVWTNAYTAVLGVRAHIGQAAATNVTVINCDIGAQGNPLHFAHTNKVTLTVINSIVRSCHRVLDSLGRSGSAPFTNNEFRIIGSTLISDRRGATQTDSIDLGDTYFLYTEGGEFLLQDCTMLGIGGSGQMFFYGGLTPGSRAQLMSCSISNDIAPVVLGDSTFPITLSGCYLNGKPFIPNRPAASGGLLDGKQLWNGQFTNYANVSTNLYATNMADGQTIRVFGKSVGSVSTTFPQANATNTSKGLGLVGGLSNCVWVATITRHGSITNFEFSVPDYTDVAGANVTLTLDHVLRTRTIASTGGGGAGTTTNVVFYGATNGAALTQVPLPGVATNFSQVLNTNLQPVVYTDSNSVFTASNTVTKGTGTNWGNAGVGGTFVVNGQTSLKATLTLADGVDIQQAGAATASASLDNITAEGTLGVTGSATFTSSATVSGQTAVKGAFVEEITRTGLAIDITSAPSFVFETNQVVTFTFSGTPQLGQRLSLIVSNTATTNWLATIPSSFYPPVGTNITTWTIATNSQQVFDFRYCTNVGAAFWMLELVKQRGAELAVASFGANGFLALSTNVTGSIITASNTYLPQNSTQAPTNLAGITNPPSITVGWLELTNNVRVRQVDYSGSTSATQMDFTISSKYVLTNANGLNTNQTYNLTNPVAGYSMMLEVPANKLGTNFTVNVTIAAGSTSTNIIWLSPTNGNFTFTAQSNATYYVALVVDSGPTVTNIIASWSTSTGNPIRGLVNLAAAGNSASNIAVGGILYRAVTVPAFTNLNATIATFTNASQCIIGAHTLTNTGDTLKILWRGYMLAGTNSFKFNYGYESALQTGSFTNGNTAWEGGMELTRTAGVGAQCHAWLLFDQTSPALTSFALSGVLTNLTLSCTNGTDITNVLQIASNRTGSISNNFHAVYFEPASR